MAGDVIKQYLDKQTKETLAYPEPTSDPTAGSNLVELTEEIVGNVVDLLMEGKNLREIKKAVKLPNPKAGNALTLSLSFGQLKEIEARDKKEKQKQRRAVKSSLRVVRTNPGDGGPEEEVP